MEHQSASQHILLFTIEFLTSGFFFSWAVLEDCMAARGMEGARSQGLGFVTALATFVLSGIACHLGVLPAVVRRVRLRALVAAAGAVFAVGMGLLTVGAYFWAPLVLAAAVVTTSAATLIYTAMFYLADQYRFFSTLSSVAFAGSSLLFQCYSLDVPFWTVGAAWSLALCLCLPFFRPDEERVARPAEARSCRGMFRVLGTRECVPVYAGLLFSMVGKIYYQNNYFRRLDVYRLHSDAMVMAFSLSNFLGVLGGLLNLMPPERAHVATLGGIAVFYALATADADLHNPVLISANLFLMNVSTTGMITSALVLVARLSDRLETDAAVYFVLGLGNAIGIGLSYVSDIRLADLVVMPVCLVAVCATALADVVLWRRLPRTGPDQKGTRLYESL